MKKLTLLLLLMTSTNVLAEWIEITRSKDGDITVYVDYVTRKKKGNKVKMWRLFDYKTVHIGPTNDRYLSSVVHNEFDCEEETIRMLDLYIYSRNMRQGDAVKSEHNIKEEATSIIPESISDGLLIKACDK